MSDRKKREIQPIHEKPFGDILHSMDHFFTQAIQHFHTPRTIPVHQYETADEYIIEAELPGIKKKQINLDIFQNYIKISVEDEAFTEKKDDTQKITEQSLRYQRADRLVTLPFAVNQSDVKASLSQGLLVIRIPNRRKRIPIDTKEV
ncbi:Hsp20/alpha crystallin family protein [Salipaludibacillus agaradhaerens]|uniref:Hsp20/alpha crystallin family protein n=1 Tax=Salipaludibacillus agaradhaerens TaxID=76935 RepID=UPI002151C853|nr:Hsp20/alpha crystallin family protein [Salipaludibacillus agaradhaerens]MCR6107250.1 Hsp20/alpha crystallin family protein [Salipaludibacillus agaradhaerens]MCR6119279.1 Hsp20/alpha crystallin family protein [Salipaludibacillus agaradhaerens]UJW58317.1 Hsp20/alpha crystallin family protein [Bacillus sp. A116_S68]